MIKYHQPVVIVKELVVLTVLAIRVEKVRKFGAALVDEMPGETGALLDVLSGVLVWALVHDIGIAVLPPGLAGTPVRVADKTSRTACPSHFWIRREPQNLVRPIAKPGWAAILQPSTRESRVNACRVENWDQLRRARRSRMCVLCRTAEEEGEGHLRGASNWGEAPAESA